MLALIIVHNATQIKPQLDRKPHVWVISLCQLFTSSESFNWLKYINKVITILRSCCVQKYTEKVSTRSSWCLINNFNYIFDFRYHNGRLLNVKIGRFILTINSSLYIMNERPADTGVWKLTDSTDNTCMVSCIMNLLS